MKALCLLKIAACLLLAASLCSCLAYGSGNSGDQKSDDDIASDNNTVIDNSVRGSDSDELLEGEPCSEALWKPVSESDGNLAIVSGVGDVRPWNSVAVCQAAEEEPPAEEGAPATLAKEAGFCAAGEIAFCEHAGITPEGDRQVWRCSKPGAEYSGEFEIEYAGESCSAEVEDPAARNDQ